jgi:hypothetical protein
MSGSSNTLIRLPLRQAPGRGAGPNGLPLPSPSLASVRRALAAFAQAAAASLPLLGALGEVVVDVWQPGSSSAMPVSWLSTTALNRPGDVLGWVQPVFGMVSLLTALSMLCIHGLIWDDDFLVTHTPWSS